jgi:hypothetical protein
MDYKKAVENVMIDPRYKRNVEWGKPRPGHPEGKVKYHIAELESNLAQLKHRLTGKNDYWKLMLLIHVHDMFKAEASKGVPATDPRSHGSLAREFASDFINDKDLLTIIQYHGVSYFLWRQLRATGEYDTKVFMDLLSIIDNWDLFLAFTIIDGNTKGKDIEKLPWFIAEVRRYKETLVDESWVQK